MFGRKRMPELPPDPGLIVTVMGDGKRLSVYPDRVVWTRYRRGKPVGETTLPYRAIEGVELRTPGLVTPGHLRLIVAGAPMKRGWGAMPEVNDPNSLIFTTRDTAPYEAAKRAIERAITATP